MDTIAGLPAHPLFVHLAVVAIPLTAVLAILASIWPAARRRLGWFTPAVAVVAMTITPLTTSAGETLEKQVPRSEALHSHTELGGQMLYWVAALFVLVVLSWAMYDDTIARRIPAVASVRAHGWLRVVLAVATIVVALGALVMVVRVGDSGARSVWLG